MTPQKVIKTFMATLANNAYSYSSSVSSAMLDDAVKASSRFLGIQNAIDNMKADQVKAEREAVEEILGSAYAGKTMSEVGSIINSDAKSFSNTKISNAYQEGYSDGRTTLKRVIMERKAYIFLEKYCGIKLPSNYWFASDTTPTYWSGEYSSSGNVDTGAITGSDANITLTAGDVIYGTTLTAADLKEFAKQDGASLSGDTLIIGTGTEKTRTSVVPEIGNTYTVTNSTAQNIATGSHDWIVIASGKNDTISTGGADSVDAGAGNDKITVGADYASVLTGAGNDTVEIAATVNNVTLTDLNSTDAVKINGTFNAGSAQLEDTILVVTDKTGARKIYFANYDAARNAKINGTALTTWLSKAGFDIDNLQATSSANASPAPNEPVLLDVSEQIDGSSTYTPVEYADAERAAQTLSSANVNLDDVTLTKGDIYVGKNKVGEISSSFPNISSFTKNGLTIDLLGVTSEKTPNYNKLTATTLDELTDDQKTVLAGIFKWWAKEAMKLNEDSYDLYYSSADSTMKKIRVLFFDSQGTGSTLASIGGSVTAHLNINMNYYKGIDEDDVDGNGAGTSSLLDRTLAHEFTHALMSANIDWFGSLPQFIVEGSAELTHGIDDSRGSEIFQLANDASKLSKVLDVNNTGTGNSEFYSGGYMFMRYLAKQGALQNLVDYANPDAGASWSIAKNVATYTVDGQVVATLKGLAKGIAVTGNMIDGISVDGKTITLSQKVLGTANVTFGTNEGYTLALGEDLRDKQVVISNKVWTFKNGTATLTGDYSTGYSLSSDGQTIIYQQPKIKQTLATVSGLAKEGVSASDFDPTGKIITLKDSMVGTSNVKVTGEGYTLVLAADVIKPVDQPKEWDLNGTTATYQYNTTEGFTLSEDSKTAVFSKPITTKLTTVSGIKKITEENKATVAKSIIASSSGNKITIGANALGTSNVSVTNGYTLALGASAPKPAKQPEEWILNGSTATYQYDTTAGFTLSDDKKSAVYSKPTTTKLVTVSGIQKVTEENKDTVAKAITISDTTITLGANALGTSNVSVNNGYTLALAADAPKPTDQPEEWDLNGTTATYQYDTTAGFTLSANGKSATYSKLKTTKLATVSGIKKITEENKATVAKSIIASSSGNKITIGANALGTSNVKVTGEGYTLALGASAPKPVDQPKEWDLKGSTATYQYDTTAGFTLSDDKKSAKYSKPTTTKLVTVSGIQKVTEENKDAVAQAITISDTTVTLGANALGTSNVSVNNGYTLALAADALKPTKQPEEWILNGTSATYQYDTTAGFTLAENAKSAAYSKLKTTKLVTVSGIQKVTEENKSAVAQAIKISDKTITLGANALGTSKVSVNNGYTLALDSSVPKPVDQTPYWEVSGTNALYKQDTTAGFTLAADKKSAPYSKEKVTTLATVSGLQKGLAVVDNAIDGITLAGNVISLDTKVLGAGKVSVKGDYTLAVDNSLTASSNRDRWIVNGTNATYDNVQSFYYVPSADNKTFTYNKEAILKNLVTVKGLTKGATVNGNGNITGVDGGSISISNKAVTLQGDASFGNKVEVLLADGYTLTNKLTAPVVTKTYWVAKSGTAKLYQDRTEGYTLTENEKTGAQILTYSKANAVNVATVSGLNKTLVDTEGAVDGITIADNVISLDAKVLNNAKVSLAKNDAYTLALDKSLTTLTTQDRWLVNGTNATYDNVQNPYYIPSEDNKTLNYSKEVTLKNLVTVKGLIKGATVNGSGNITCVDGGSISISNKAVTLKGDASFGNKVEVLLSDGYTLTNRLTAPAVTKTYWVASGGTAKLNQDIAEGYTLTENEKTGAQILTYSKANTATRATVSGLNKNLVDTDGALAGISYDLTAHTVTVDKRAVGTSNISVKEKDYTLGIVTSGDNAVPTAPAETNLWEVSGTKALYKNVTIGYFTQKDERNYTYTAQKTLQTLATLNGLKKDASASSFSLNGNVITLTADALDENPTAKTKITLAQNDNYILKLGTGLTAVAYNDAVWSFDNKNKATYTATVKTAGYSPSADNKTITYIPAQDAKGNATTATYATLTGVKSANGITVKNKIITLTDAALNETKVSLANTDDYTLALGNASLAPAAESDETWAVSGTKATLSMLVSKGYTLSDDGKSLTYSNKSTTKTLASINGINKDADASTFLATPDGSTKKVTLKAAQLSDKVTVGGEYKFVFASDYKNSTIIGSAASDTISVAGSGLSVTGGKGNDSITFGGSNNTFIYANGDGNDIIADFTAVNDKLKITSGKPTVAASGANAVVAVGAGTITLTNAAANVDSIIIVDGRDNQIYPVNSAALLEDDNFDDTDALDDITDTPLADNSLGDLNLNQDATKLTPQSDIVTYGDDDK